MATTVVSAQHGVIQLLDGTSFELETSAIENYGIAVGDQAIVTQTEAGQVVTIFLLHRHKADIRLLPSRSGLPKGQVSVGTPCKPAYDPARPFSGNYRL